MFFTPGDLLAEFADRLPLLAQPETVLTEFLCRELRSEEDARIAQAGDRTEGRLSLAKVFTDLPLMDERSESIRQKAPAPGAIHKLLQAGSRKLDPLALEESRPSGAEQRMFGADPLYFGRYMFLGGPGSGKSTIGQFLALIHRSALLKRRPVHLLEPAVRQMIEAVEIRCGQLNLAWPTTPRYPFRIELNSFAKALATKIEAERVKSLSEYLLQQMRGDFQMTHEQLRSWLGVFPSILILDGLDEVPSSSNRSEVMRAIQNFLSEARSCEADMLVIASSRPDGYDAEFGSQEFSQHVLAPLDKALALQCAEAYVRAKFGDNANRAEATLTILRESVENPLVEKIMISPLQVTFMVTVVAASGKPSESRWQLFSDYYRTIYERELHKAVPPFSEILNKRRNDIDTLHHRIGFLLQARGEADGQTNAQLSIYEFSTIAEECLTESGIEDPERTRQLHLMVEAARLRLVFLSSRTPNKLSFEVRSLQEYMAAYCLTNGNNSERVQLRLQRIACSSYWRNTLLFAVGRFFADTNLRVERDRIRILCEDLNEKDETLRLPKAGSRLALDILQSGVVGDAVLFSKGLIKCGLEILQMPLFQSNVAHKFTDIISSPLEDLFVEQISLHLGQQEIGDALSAWMVLLVLSLSRQENSRVHTLAQEFWPADVSVATKILELGLQVNDQAELGNIPELQIELLEQLIQSLGPLNIPREMQHPLRSMRFTAEHLEFSKYPGVTWVAARDFHDDGTEVHILLPDRENGLHTNLIFCGLSDRVRHWLNEGLAATKRLPAWNLPAYWAFLKDPHAKSLSAALRELANIPQALGKESFPSFYAPWPLAFCLQTTNDATELEEIAKKVDQGLYGNATDWKRIERRWIETGISLDEIATGVAGTLFLTDSVGVLRLWIGNDPGNDRAALEILSAIEQCNARGARAKLTSMLGWLLTHTDAEALSPQRILENCALAISEQSVPFFSWQCQSIPVGNEYWIKIWELLGRNLSTKSSRAWKLRDAPTEALAAAFNEDTARLGVLRLMGFWTVCGVSFPSVDKADLDWHRSDVDSHFVLAMVLVRMGQENFTREEGDDCVARLPTIIRDAASDSPWILLTDAAGFHSHRSEGMAPILSFLVRNIPNAANQTFWKMISAQGSCFTKEVTSVLSLPKTEPIAEI
jgi:hypothetical protein